MPIHLPVPSSVTSVLFFHSKTHIDILNFSYFLSYYLIIHTPTADCCQAACPATGTVTATHHCVLGAVIGFSEMDSFFLPWKCETCCCAGGIISHSKISCCIHSKHEFRYSLSFIFLSQFLFVLSFFKTSFFKTELETVLLISFFLHLYIYKGKIKEFSFLWGFHIMP